MLRIVAIAFLASCASGSRDSGSQNSLDANDTGIIEGDGAMPHAVAKRIGAGFAFTCAITKSGGVKCWGINTHGQLGDGTTTDRTVPVDVVGLDAGIVDLAVGQEHACALTQQGRVLCWGRGDFGALGNGSFVSSSTPVAVAGVTGATAISGGYNHTCAVTAAGGVTCWGENLWGALGDGTTTARASPVDVVGLGSGVAAVSAGGFTCAVTTVGSVLCWGNAQLGSTHSTPSSVVDLTSGVSRIAVGLNGACALTTSGSLKCWGINSSGAVGDGTTTTRTTPVTVIPSGARGVARTYESTYALTEAGMLSWGNNQGGELGDGTHAWRVVPGPVLGVAGSVSQIAPGYGHACVLLDTGRAQCWGRNDYGQLGDGTTVERLAAVDVVVL